MQSLHTKNLKQLPNILSVIRITLSPIFFFLLISQNRDFNCFALPVFMICAITDYLDGWLARKMQAISKFGKFFDPLADKILTGFAFIGFYILDIAPLWMVLIIISRDVITTIMRVANNNRFPVLITSHVAKIKTFVQMLFISFVVAYYSIYRCPFINAPIDTAILYSDYTYYTLFFIVILTVWTLVDYALKFISHK